MAASGRELCWFAPTAYTPSGSLPSGAPRPDDASKAQFVMAGLLARGSLPDRRLPGNSQWHRRGLVAYSCGGSAGVENTRTGFPFHLPRGRTITGNASRRGRRGQPELTCWRQSVERGDIKMSDRDLGIMALAVTTGRQRIGAPV